jgi:hypothetical protein
MDFNVLKILFLKYLHPIFEFLNYNFVINFKYFIHQFKYILDFLKESIYFQFIFALFNHIDSIQNYLLITTCQLSLLHFHLIFIKGSSLYFLFYSHFYFYTILHFTLIIVMHRFRKVNFLNNLFIIQKFKYFYLKN